MTPFTLYLMRHGEPELTGRMLGHTDSRATAAGIAICRDQAAGLAPARIISSDLRRARSCAETIGKTAFDPRWRELDFGDWDGLASSEIDATSLAAFWSDPDANPPPGGERWSALMARVAAAIDDLAQETTLIVTHGGTMRAALSILCGFDVAKTWAFELPYGVVVALKVWPVPPRSAQISGLWPCAA